MALRIGGLPVLIGPGDVIAGARAVMGWTDDAVGLVSSLPERANGLLVELELLIQRVGRIADHAEATLVRADELIDSVDEVLAGAHTSVVGVEAVLAKAEAVTSRAAGVVDEAATVTGDAAGIVGTAAGVTSSATGVVERANAVAEHAQTVIVSAGGAAADAAALLAVYEPIAERAAPLARRFVEEFSEEELHAAIRLVDTLPQLTASVERDVLPILTTLDRVGPDITELLNVVKDVRQALQSIPGFRMLRRRGENGGDGGR